MMASTKHHTSGNSRLGILGEFAGQTAAIPENLRDIIYSLPPLKNQKFRAKQQHHASNNIWFFDEQRVNKLVLGYVLINRFDADVGQSVSELWDLDSRRRVKVRFSKDFNLEIMFHSYVSPSGSLITHGNNTPPFQEKLMPNLQSNF